MLLQRLEKAFHIPQPGAWVFNVCASQAQALGSIEQFKVFGPPEEPCFSLASAPKLEAASIMGRSWGRRLLTRILSSSRRTRSSVSAGRELCTCATSSASNCTSLAGPGRASRLVHAQTPHAMCKLPRSTPNVKHAVKTIPIWRLLMDSFCRLFLCAAPLYSASQMCALDLVWRPPARGIRLPVGLVYCLHTKLAYVPLSGSLARAC